MIKQVLAIAIHPLAPIDIGVSGVQNDNNGRWHWNGSTDGKTKGGEERKIPLNQVPNIIL